MNADELIALNEQIAGMARAGLPLDQGLAGLARDMSRGRLRRVTEGIATDLKAGSTLPEAIERHRSELPPYYANLITAGIRTGRLPDVLSTLTSYARTVNTTRLIVIDSLFYPIVVLFFAMVLFGLLMFFVMPQFDQIFADFQMKLPTVTEIVFGIARHPVLFLVTPLAVFVLLPLLVRAFLSTTERGRVTWAHLVYAVPVIGTLLKSARLAAFADLLAMLVDYELPLPEAFRLAGEASSDPVMAYRAKEIADRLDQGMPIAEALRGRGLLPEWVAWMTGAGNERGTLAQTLRQIATLYQRQVQSRSALLRTVLPSIVIIMTAGTLTGAFVLSVMLPMIKLVEGLSK
ncbi:MAG: type II secretion system F family protein [Gemmataceae bacterium]